MAADDYNPEGYGESDALFGLHQRLLEASGNRWDAWVRIDPDWFESPIASQFVDECRSLLTREFGDAPLFVVKDPRMCRFVPFWLRVLRAENITPVAMVAVRSPLEVARHSRQGTGSRGINPF